MMKRGLWLAAVLSLAACPEKLDRVSLELAVAPGAIEFMPTTVGASSTRLLTLTNGSRRDADVVATVEGPFAIDVTVVPAGTDILVPVRFSPAAVGLQRGRITIESELGTMEVALSGEGVQPALCETTDPCKRTTLNVATNTCVDSNAPDGTACTSACLSAGQCRTGVCVGTAVSCDDGDACTTDSCEASTGCQHAPAQCTEPADPCLVPVCDPVTGCGTAPAADGTSCGAADCVTAHICLSGRCEVRNVPEGATCGSSSPCQAAGRCANQQCVQPAPGPLTQLWSQTLPFDAQFRGVTDGAGNLYWLNGASTQFFAGSFSVNGLSRWSVSVPGSGQSSAAQQLFVDGRFIVAIGAHLTALGESDGRRVWTRQVAGANAVVTALAADGRGQLHAIVDLTRSTGGWALSTFDASNGTLKRTRQLMGRTVALMLDAAGTVYFLENSLQAAGEDRGAAPPGDVPTTCQVSSVDASGNFRWRTALNVCARPLAVVGTRLLLADRSTIDTATGARDDVANVGGSWSNVGPALMTRTQQFQFFTSLTDDKYGTHLGAVVGGVESPATGPWQASANGEFTDPLLLADGSALFASRQLYEVTPRLRAFTAAGLERFACDLVTITLGGSPTVWNQATSLSGGRWATVTSEDCPACVIGSPPTLRVYSVATETLSASGWSAGAGGNLQRTGQAR